MSKLMIRGGYGEHGRSCFLVEYGDMGRMYMVDCGIMDTDPFPYPDVTPEELGRVDYLFLTHCHKDHSGAFEYFCERGFSGTLVTAGITCRLAGIDYKKTVELEVGGANAQGAAAEINVLEAESNAAAAGSNVPAVGLEQAGVGTEPGNCRKFGPLTVRYGRTGHCPGGLWFEIAECVGEAADAGTNAKAYGSREDLQSGHNTIFFSGDYQEDTLVYVCDPIRGKCAKLALIDCAHRGTELDAEALRAQILRVVNEKLQNGQRVILPVPQYGRGLELLFLMQREFPKLRVRVDGDFVNYARKMVSERVWYYEEAYRELDVEKMDVLDVETVYAMAGTGAGAGPGVENTGYSDCQDVKWDSSCEGLNEGGMADNAYDILLLADTHLKQRKNQNFVNRAIDAGEAVLINGRVKKNGPVGKLLDAGKAEKFLFPHHQSYGDLKRVAAANRFDVVLPFHNNEKEVLI